MTSTLFHVLFSVGASIRPGGLAGRGLAIYAAGVAAWVYYAVTIALIDRLALTAIFVGLVFTLLFLVVGPTPVSKTGKPGIIDYMLSAASAGCCVFFILNHETIASRISLLDPLSELDMVVGTAFVILTLEATRRSVGIALTAIVLIFMVYNLFGHHLSGVIAHGHISYEHFLDQTVFTTFGIFGAPARVAASYAFLFVAFGIFLQRVGGSEFFFNLAAAISGRTPGGPAKVAVSSSALYGTISGSPTSDVVTTGSITIPMMRKIGYPPTLAGAVEVAASAGGSILPPVMGSAAFIMVEVAGIPYQTIVLAAVVPAIIYFVGVYLQVHLRSLRLGLRGLGRDEVPRVVETLKSGGIFAVPLIVIVVALLLGYSPSFVAVFATIAVLVVSSLRKSTRLTPKGVVETLTQVTISMVPVTAACAAAGLVIGGISMTGLSGKLALLITAAGGGHFLPILITAAVVAIVLGMGMPTPSAYIMAAVLVGPVIIKLGVPELNAHMFLLFFAAMSAITPPVAVAAYAAASIAQANPILIAAMAVRIAAAGFVLPFAFVVEPALLLQGSAVDIAWAATTTLIAIVGFSFAVEGHADGPMRAWQRLIAAAGGITMLVPGLTNDLAGFLLIAIAIGPGLMGWARGRRENAAQKDVS